MTITFDLAAPGKVMYGSLARSAFGSRNLLVDASETGSFERTLRRAARQVLMES